VNIRKIVISLFSITSFLLLIFVATYEVQQRQELRTKATSEEPEFDFPVGGDAFLPPPPGIFTKELSLKEVTAMSISDYDYHYSEWLATQTETSPVPGYYETSEFMIGSVAVAVILPESNGEVDPNTEDWTVEEINNVKREVEGGANWWVARNPESHLSFVFEWYTVDDVLPASLIETSIEPITRPYYDQSIWIAEIMNNLGYLSTSYWDNIRQFNNDLRTKHETDWSLAIFVVDSSNDADNKFANDYFAYAYLGGPFFVMTYGNDGYGIYKMDAVCAHEMGHSFLALDQYYSDYQPCDRQSGYLGVENQNSQYGTCLLDVLSIMRGGSLPYINGAVDNYARGQLGWWDQNSDNSPDPIDADFNITLDLPINIDGDLVYSSGIAEHIPYPSPLRRSITINKIESVQYRINEDAWTDAVATDGDFDSYKEVFRFTPTSAIGFYIDIKVVDNFGGQSQITLPSARPTLTPTPPSCPIGDLCKMGCPSPCVCCGVTCYEPNHDCFATPTLPPTPTSAPPLTCLNMTCSLAMPELGEYVTFTCAYSGAVDYGPNQFYFRYQVDGGNYVNIGWDESSLFYTGTQWIANSQLIRLLRSGVYNVECMGCRNDVCASWEIAQ